MKVVKHTFGFSIEKICVVFPADVAVEAYDKAASGTSPVEIKKCCITNIARFGNTLHNPFPADVILLPKVLGDSSPLLRHDEVKICLEQLQTIFGLFNTQTVRSIISSSFPHFSVIYSNVFFAVRIAKSSYGKLAIFHVVT